MSAVKFGSGKRTTRIQNCLQQQPAIPTIIAASDFNACDPCLAWQAKFVAAWMPAEAPSPIDPIPDFVATLG